MDRPFDERFDQLGLESAFASEAEADEAPFRHSLDFGEAMFAAPAGDPHGETSAWLGEVLEAEDQAARESPAQWLETEWLDTSGEAASNAETPEAFADRLGHEWSRRRRGDPAPDAMRAWLLQDLQDTLAGAGIRRRNAGKAITPGFLAEMTRAWMTGRENQMRFKTEPGTGVAALRGFAPPAARVGLVDDPLIGGSRDSVRNGKTVPGAKVAPLTVRFARALRSRHRSVSMTNYHGHGGGAFRDRGYSLDLWLSGTDDRGFYRPDEAIALLRAVDAAARSVGAQWQVLYNDFTVADAINRELRRRHVVFVGNVRRNQAKKVTGINWHGPEPLILHFHLDIAPMSGVEQSEADEAEGTGEAFAAERAEEDAGERWRESEGDFEHDLGETDRLLQAGDWRGAVTAAIKAGERDQDKLTNLVFFARHPDLDRTRPLQPKQSKADAKLAAEWNKVALTEVWPAITAIARNPVLAVDGAQIAGWLKHFRGKAGARFKQLVEATARKVGLNPGMLAAALLAEIGTTFDYLSSEKVSSYRIGVDDFYAMRTVLANAVPAYADIRWDKKQTPVVHLNDAQTTPREVKTIWFDSGPDALLATAVYLKYGELRLRSDAKALGGDFDALAVETRLALLRMSMAAGRAGAQIRLARALKGADILVRDWAAPKAYQTGRNATIRAAEAMFLSGWVFGLPLTAQPFTARPPARPQPEQADEGARFYTAPWEAAAPAERQDEDLAWLALEADSPTPLLEDEGEGPEGEWAGEDHALLESEWYEAESPEPAEAAYFDQSESEATQDFAEAPDQGERSPDIATLEALLESDIGAGEVAARLKAATVFALGPVLRRGSRGPAVESLQRALIRIGTSVPGTALAAADGAFGPATERAVRDFQTRSGLTADGVVGATTKAALAAALGGRPAAATIGPFSVKLYPAEMAPDAGHNARLATALANTRATLAVPANATAIAKWTALEKQSMLDKVAMIIVRLMPSGPMAYAGVREDEMFFSGSLLKMALLHPSFELVERVNALAPQISATSPADFFAKVGQAFDARIAAAVPQIPAGPWQKVAFNRILEAVPAGAGYTVRMSKQHHADLTRIFVDQNQNVAARDCLQCLGFSYVNGNADAAGFFGVVTQKGIWMATDYSPPGAINWPSYNLPVATNGTSSAAMTVLSMANLVAQIKRGRLINATASGEMLRIFQRGGAWLSLLPNRASMSFTAMGAKVGHSASDTAKVQDVKSEAALLRRTSDGAEFVCVWQNVPDTLDYAPIYNVIDDVIRTWP